ncbi:MAG: hypothetical protein R2824_14430 [Saprospiraceae bacterium]|nr:hypothetical protein [Lewinella sp.]
MQPNLQDDLIDKILNRFPKKSQAAEKLMEVLSLNRDGVYRRLRGDTMLNAVEIQTLATHFDISLDSILSDKQGKVSFSYNRSEQPISSFLDYLQLINYQISLFVRQPNIHAHYTAREVPIFIYMMFPRLMALKLYIYGLTNWNLDYLQHRKFRFDLITAKELEIAYATGKLYCALDSTDYWTLSFLDQSLNQIEYMLLDGRFERAEDAFEICSDLVELVRHCRHMAEEGKKFMPGQKPLEQNGQFELFHNELTGTYNTILGVTETHSILYHTLDGPNFIFTTDQEMCSYMERWFQSMISTSTAISIHSSKNRNYYFNRLEEKVNQMARRLELLIPQL